MKEDIKKIFKKAKELGILISGWEERFFDAIEILEDGEIQVKFSHYYSGDTDYKSVFLSESDLSDPIDEVVKRHKEVEEEQKRKEKKEKEERDLKSKEDREKNEYEKYLTLRKKFEL